MARKIGAVVVMILAVLGALICLAVLIGAWAVRGPAIEGGTAALEAVGGYLELAEKAADLSAVAGGRVSDRLFEVQESVAAGRVNIEEAVGGLVGEIVGWIGPTVTTIRATVEALAVSAVSLNNTLVAVNRIPGVEVPTFTAELEEIGARLAEVDARLTAIRTAAGDRLPDGTPVQTAVGRTAEDLAALSTSLDDWSNRLNATATAAADLQTNLPSIVTWLVIGVTLLMLLLGAGQVSLFVHALEWYRRA